MADAPTYVILGRGRWARRMQTILAGENRRVATIPDARRAPDETDPAYRGRLANAMRASNSQIVWLCVLPGPHVETAIDAALDADLHVVVEKPWLGSALATGKLAARAKKLRRVIAVHFEYCFLEDVENWRREFHTQTDLRFGGRFFLSRPNHTGMTPMDNLGSHLLSIRAFAVPYSTIQEISCGYEQPDDRSVWLDKNRIKLATINLLANKEPIIQRFVASFEASLDTTDFPLNLEFAHRIKEDAETLLRESRRPNASN